MTNIFPQTLLAWLLQFYVQLARGFAIFCFPHLNTIFFGRAFVFSTPSFLLMQSSASLLEVLLLAWTGAR